MDARQPHGVVRFTAAIGGAPGIEDLEAAGAFLVERDVRVSEDHGVGARKAPSQPGEPPPGWTRVVDHREARATGLDLQGPGQPLSNLGRVDVPVHREHGRAQGLELGERSDVEHVSRVED